MLAQIYPDKIVTYHQRKQTTLTPTQLVERHYGIKQERPRNLQKSKTAFSLSEASKRELKKSVTQVYHLATPTTIVTNTGKVIRNFKASLVTLTLPSTQEHTDIKIKLILGTYLNWLRFKGLSNYVWKAELQKNGNIHFHLVIDKFFNVHELQRHWNTLLDKHDYVEPYRERFRSMSISDYAKQFSITYAKAEERYAKGSAKGWSDPPTVDVKPIKNSSQLSRYLAKYLTKPAAGNNQDTTESERAATFGKTWSRSQSISNIKWYPVERAEIESELMTLDQLKSVYVFSTCFYSVYCFNLEHIPKPIATFIREFNHNRALESGYFQNKQFT